MGDSSYVVNMQCFKTLDNKFVIKELCIKELCAKVAYHCVFKPPVNYASLSREMRKRVDYVTRYVHGLRWGSGYRNQHEAIVALKSMLSNANRVYIKGSENVAFLKKILKPNVTVIDLDIFDYSNGREINEKIYPKCEEGYSHRRLRCALQKVYAYGVWLEKHVEKKYK